jgi:hypothetical protein
MSFGRQSEHPSPISEDILDQWEKDFRTSAFADGISIFRDHLRRLDLPDSPQLMFEGTIRGLNDLLKFP